MPITEIIMIKIVSKIVNDVKAHLQIKTKMRYIVDASIHFQERYIERFTEDDIPQIERTIEKAIEKIAVFGKPTRYKHPAYGFTVVIKRVGLNGAELVTCWKNEKDAE